MFLKRAKTYKKVLSFLLVFLLVFYGFVVAVRTVFPLKYLKTVKTYAAQYGLEVSFVCAVIQAESRFNKNAVSKKGASGLMQLMQTTANWGAEEIGMQNYSYSRIFEPEINIQLGCWYLSKLLNQYQGDKKTALASYNAGSGNVAKWLQNKKYSDDGMKVSSIPFSETDAYTKKIAQYEKVYQILLFIEEILPFSFFGGAHE